MKGFVEVHVNRKKEGKGKQLIAVSKIISVSEYFDRAFIEIYRKNNDAYGVETNESYSEVLDKIAEALKQ